MSGLRVRFGPGTVQRVFSSRKLEAFCTAKANIICSNIISQVENAAGTASIASTPAAGSANRAANPEGCDSSESSGSGSSDSDGDTEESAPPVKKRKSGEKRAKVNVKVEQEEKSPGKSKGPKAAAVTSDAQIEDREGSNVVVRLNKVLSDIEAGTFDDTRGRLLQTLLREWAGIVTDAKNVAKKASEDIKLKITGAVTAVERVKAFLKAATKAAPTLLEITRTFDLIAAASCKLSTRWYGEVVLKNVEHLLASNDVEKAMLFATPDDTLKYGPHIAGDGCSELCMEVAKKLVAHICPTKIPVGAKSGGRCPNGREVLEQDVRLAEGVGGLRGGSLTAQSLANASHSRVEGRGFSLAGVLEENRPQCDHGHLHRQ